jgi:hypothetical protein
MGAFDFIAQGVQPVQLADPMRLAAAGMSLADLARRNRQGEDDERVKALDRQASVLAAQGFAKVQQGSDYRTVMAELANQGEVGAYAAQKMLKVKKEDEGAQADLDLKRSTTSKNYSDADDKQFQRRVKGFGDIANAASGGADMRLLQSMSEFYGIPLPAQPQGMDENTYRQGIAATALSAKDRMQNDTTIRGQDVGAETSRRGQDLTRQSSIEGHNITARGQNMTDARSRELAAATRAEGGKPPAGYRWKPDGSLEAIAGGPAAGGADKPLTESQSNSTMFGMRAVDMDRTMKELQAGGYDPTGVGAAKDLSTAGRLTTNWMASGNGQQYINAGKNFVAATLRKESGAQISESEWADGVQRYIPMPGDSPQLVQQKERNRELVKRGFSAGAGRAGASEIDKGAARGAPQNRDALVREAMDAISKGADPAKVKARLQELGITDAKI